MVATTVGSYTMYSFSQDAQAGNPYTSLKADIQNGNCKMTFLMGIGSVIKLENITDEQKLYMLNAVMKQAKLLVYCNTPDKDVKDFLEKHYEFYDSCEIPVGYKLPGYKSAHKGIQYHIFIRNPFQKNSEYSRKPLKKKEEKSKI